MSIQRLLPKVNAGDRILVRTFNIATLPRHQPRAFGGTAPGFTAGSDCIISDRGGRAVRSLGQRRGSSDAGLIERYSVTECEFRWRSDCQFDCGEKITS